DRAIGRRLVGQAQLVIEQVVFAAGAVERRRAGGVVATAGGIAAAYAVIVPAQSDAGLPLFVELDHGEAVERDRVGGIAGRIVVARQVARIIVMRIRIPQRGAQGRVAGVVGAHLARHRALGDGLGIRVLVLLDVAVLEAQVERVLQA